MSELRVGRDVGGGGERGWERWLTSTSFEDFFEVAYSACLFNEHRHSGAADFHEQLHFCGKISNQQQK